MTGAESIQPLGLAQIYPITAPLQWHMLEGTGVRPYVGVGAGHVILRNIDKRTSGVSGARFEAPTGLVVDGGLEFSLSRRWSALVDARYTPIETRSRVTFIGTRFERPDRRETADRLDGNRLSFLSVDR